MNREPPIRIADGVDLISKSPGIAMVRVSDPAAKRNLSWDRFVRLKAVAQAVLETNSLSILDVGGYDGALGLFLPDAAIDIIDPATTGGSVLNMSATNGSYDAVVAVDLLEHIEPKDRSKALSELARVARQHVILNYPCHDSKEAQELALKLTGNTLIHDHVQWELPNSEWVSGEMERYGFSSTVKAHTSIAIWLSQFVTLNLVPEVAKELNCHLVKNHSDEPCSKALYHLVVCERKNDG